MPVPPVYRGDYLRRLQKDLTKSRVVTLLGPRQCGKTTLARSLLSEHTGPIHFFDLENPAHLNALEEPQLALESLSGLIVIDEVQRKPDLFPLLRYLVDTFEQRFFLLGSASKTLLQQTSESLAGRIRYVEVTPFSLSEVGNFEQLSFRGGFPPAYLAADDRDAVDWLKDYARTYLEVDIPALGLLIQPQKLRKFWMMLAHYHGQIYNASELSSALDIAAKTVNSYLDILEHTFMIRVLRPWFANIQKRQVKSPKIYFRDVGLYHALLGITSREQLSLHPRVGASFEGFALEEVIRLHNAEASECAFWSTHSGAQLDLLLFPETKKLAFEFKYTSTPKLTKSMQQAISDLQLAELRVIIPGDAEYRIAEKVRVIGLTRYIATAIK